MNTQPIDFQEAIPEVDAVATKLADAMTPGAQIEFDPSEAERAGAFQEQALSVEDAEAATAEVLEG